MTGNAQMSAHHIDEGGIALGSPDGGHVTDEPEHEPRDPQPQSKSKSGGQGSVDDGDRSRRTAHQDRLGERTVNGHDKTCDRLIHQITTPPPKEKNDRKKLEAANAIEDTSDDPETVVQKKDTGDTLRKCLTGLSAEHREIVDLVYYHEKSVEDVAEIVGIPENTVKTRLFYARKKLAELLKAAGVERGWP